MKCFELHVHSDRQSDTLFLQRTILLSHQSIDYQMYLNEVSTSYVKCFFKAISETKLFVACQQCIVKHIDKMGGVCARGIFKQGGMAVAEDMTPVADTYPVSRTSTGLNMDIPTEEPMPKIPTGPGSLAPTLWINDKPYTIK